MTQPDTPAPCPFAEALANPNSEAHAIYDTGQICAECGISLYTSIDGLVCGNGHYARRPEPAADLSMITMLKALAVRIAAGEEMSEGLRNYAKQALDADAGEPAAGPSITMRYGNSLPEGVRPQEEPTADAEDGWEATLRYCEREWQQERAHMCRQIAELRAALKQREPAADAVEAVKIGMKNAVLWTDADGKMTLEHYHLDDAAIEALARAAIAAMPGVG